MLRNLTLAQRLLAINTALIGLLVAVAVTVWFMMGKVTMAADRINQTNVPQLQRIAELELNVTRTSLQVRHAMLARNPQELAATLADIGEKKQKLYAELKVLGEGMIDQDGRNAFAPLPALMDEFWKQGSANVALIQEGRKEEAFAFLVDKTIPARNALLAPLAAEKKRQGERLAFRIDEVKSLSNLDRDIVIGAVMVVAACLVGLALYLRNVTRQLGADPDELKRVAAAVAAGDLAVQMKVAQGDSGITSMEDAAGKSFAFADPNSTSGYLIPSVEIPAEIGATMENGDYFGEVKFVGGHEQTIVAVANGDVDAGVTWADGQGNWEDGYNSGALRKAVDAGLVDMNDLVEIWKSKPIPEGPVVLRRALSQDVKDKMIDLVKGMHAKDADCAYGIAAGETAGFTPITHDYYGSIIAVRQQQAN